MEFCHRKVDISFFFDKVYILLRTHSINNAQVETIFSKKFLDVKYALDSFFSKYVDFVKYLHFCERQVSLATNDFNIVNTIVLF